MAKERILCSAVHYDNGAKSTVLNIGSGVVICGRRHGDCIEILKGILKGIAPVDESKIPDPHERGFLTSKNRYVSRKEAFKIAKENNQIIHNMFDKDDDVALNSED